VRVVAEDQLPERRVGQVASALQVDLQAAQGLPAPALELVLGEAGVEDHVREQVEAEVDLVGGDRRVGVGGLDAGVGAQGAPHEVYGLGELLGVAGGGPLGQQRGGGLGEARLVGRLVGLA